MNSNGRKVVLIGVPCYSGVPPEVLEDWMRFAYHCGRRVPDYDFLVGIRAKSEQFRARNAIVDAAMQANVDYLLMLDDDMIIDTNDDKGISPSYTFLERMIGHDKDIVGGLYFQRQGECNPVAMMTAGAGYRFLRADEVKLGLQQVDVVGGGCMLVKMRVFDKIHRPYFEPEFNFGTDIQLCRKAREAGFEVWLDSAIELGHVRSERTIVTSRNRHQFMGDATPGEVRRFLSHDVYDRLVADAEEYTGFTREQFGFQGNAFMRVRKDFKGSDHDWYCQHGMERVARQVWFNADNADKRMMTEFILSSINHNHKSDILDFGCGIGVTAFALAEHGHRVVAMDLEGTETLRFLSWRANKYNLEIDVFPIEGDPPNTGPFDVIIAMDCLEHIPHWRRTLTLLSSMLKTGGVLFSNNAVLDDNIHPEHYPLDNADFVSCCVENGLMPVDQITYTKKEVALPTVRF